MFKWLIDWFNAPASVYQACKMTGLDCSEMRAKAEHDVKVLRDHGIIVHHPVLKEDIPRTHATLKDRSEKEMTKLWEHDDKRAIKKANVFLDSAADVFSIGVKHEYGKGRYRDWSPAVLIFKPDTVIPFIARAENDACVHSIEEAASVIQNLWGTRLKRMAWKLPIYLSGWHDISLYKIYRFFK